MSEKKVRIARFIVYGDPVGYKTTTKRSKWSDRYKEYVNYKAKVQECARNAGMKLPLVATKDRQLMINTIAYFRDGRHPDPENINKGVRDALFYKEKSYFNKSRKGDDKHTGGHFVPPRYDKENPRVLVTVKDYVRKKNNDAR